MNAHARSASLLRALLTLLACAGVPGGCNSTKGSDSQTNWLCDADSDCTIHGSDLVCVEGECVRLTTGPDGGGGRAAVGDGGGGGSSDGASPLEATALFQVSLGRAINGVPTAAVVNFLPPRCIWREFASCKVIDCRVDRVDSGLFGLTGVSAGVVTVAGGASGDVILEPDRFGIYSTESAVAWQTGDVLQIVAAGDAVPAFSGTLTFQTPLVLTTPDPGSPTGTTAFRRDAGLVISWQSTDATVTAGVAFKGVGGGTWDEIQGYCDFPGAAGTAALPPELFRDFPAGAATMYAGHSDVKSDQAGSHPLRLLTNHGSGGIPLQLL